MFSTGSVIICVSFYNCSQISVVAWTEHLATVTYLLYRKLAGLTVFITGASRGIGKAIALRAARDGANVAIAAKTAEPHPKLPGTVYTAAEEGLNIIIIADYSQHLDCAIFSYMSVQCVSVGAR